MIDKKVITHIAKLARLSLTDSEKDSLGKDLSQVIQHFEKISAVSTNGVEPLVTPTDMPGFWREDVVMGDGSAEQNMANAPDKSGHLFRVPPVV